MQVSHLQMLIDIKNDGSEAASFSSVTPRLCLHLAEETKIWGKKIEDIQIGKWVKGYLHLACQ